MAAYQTIFEKAYATGETAVTQEVILPEDSMKMVLDLMGCVYNQTGGARDSIFQPYYTFKFLMYYYSYNTSLYEFAFNGYSGLPYADSLYKGKKTGIKSMDSLIDKYDLTFDLNMYLGKYYGTVQSPFAVNTIYLSALLNTASSTNDFDPLNISTDGNYITLRRSGDTLLLTFAIRWGDCHSGCMHYKNLTYKFYDSAKIHGPYYKDNIPDIPPGPHYLVSNKKIKSAFVCSNSQRIWHYSPTIPFPFEYYMGKPWGKWFVNATEITNSMDFILGDTGTFYISHIPANSNGVWYHDTFRVILDQVPPFNGFISQDTFQLCPSIYPLQNYTNELQAELDPWLQDSIAALSWIFNPSYFTLDETVKKIQLSALSKKGGCSMKDTVSVQAIFYPANISRTIVKQCLYSPAVFKPQYKQDSVLYFYAPDYKEINYSYKGCPVMESVTVKLRNAPKIPLSKSYNLSGYDSLVLDAGNNWKTVTWNGSVLQQTFAFKGQNKNRKDTVLVRAEEQNACFDSLNIVIDQSAVASVRSTLPPNIKVYPNPAGQSLNIEADSRIIWVIYDLRGRPMFSGKGDADLDLADWSPGLYVLHTYATGSGSIIFEILK